jgi:DinB superfamily
VRRLYTFGETLLIAEAGYSMNEAAALIQEVSIARSMVLEDVRGLSDRQTAFKPEHNSWSINEVLEHLVLAEQSGVTKIWAAVEGIRLGKPVWTGEHKNSGLEIDVVVARTWKEKEEAPSIAMPHIGGPLAYWVKSFELGQSLLQALGNVLEDFNLETIIFPHFLCGPLDARQRIEFLRFHMDRHRHQINRLKNAVAFPKESDD